jgi:hypothetical protein
LLAFLLNQNVSCSKSCAAAGNAWENGENLGKPTINAFLEFNFDFFLGKEAMRRNTPVIANQVL